MFLTQGRRGNCMKCCYHTCWGHSFGDWVKKQSWEYCKSKENSSASQKSTCRLRWCSLLGNWKQEYVSSITYFVLQLLDAFGHKSNISLVFDFMETDLEVRLFKDTFISVFSNVFGNSSFNRHTFVCYIRKVPLFQLIKIMPKRFE